MDPTLPNPLIDLHQQKKQQKRQQLQQQQQQQQFLYQQSSGHFNDESSPPLPSLPHLMHNNNSNRQQMPLNLINNVPKKQHLDINNNSNNNNATAYTNMNSSPIPTQMYHASMPQQPQSMIQSKSHNEMGNDSLTFYQRSVVDIYQQPPTTVNSSSFYPNIGHDGNTQTDPSTSSVTTTSSTPQQQLVDDQQKIYSFVPLDVIFQQKRPRKKFNEVERLYSCTYLNCTKSYGTLNHLNAHVTMQGHGPKRMPIEFKELRRQLKKNKKKLQPPKPRKSSNLPQKQQQQKQDIETDIIVNEQSDILQQHPPPTFYIDRENYDDNRSMLKQQQQEFNLYGPPPARSASISTSFPNQQQFQPSASSSSSFPTRYPQYNMMQQQQFH